jgi:hypothetical protein
MVVEVNDVAVWGAACTQFALWAPRTFNRLAFITQLFYVARP